MPLGLFPLPEENDLRDIFRRVNDALRRWHFEETTKLPDPGSAFHVLREAENVRHFTRNETNAFESSAFEPVYRWALARSRREAVTLYEFLHLGRPKTAAEVSSLLGQSLLDDLVRREMLVPSSGALVSRLRASSFGPLIQLHDTRSIHESEKSSMVFCGRCSARLVLAVRDELQGAPKRSRGLDLCTGSGVQALNFAPSFEEVVGADINPRAVALAGANAAANGIGHARFVHSDLFSGVDGTFDLITANTPFLLLDEGSKATDGYGGKYGMEVELRLIADLDRYLSPRGTSVLVVSSAVVGGDNLLPRRLDEIFRGKGYEVDLFPISQYYSKDHFHAYESAGVEKCILYIMRAKKRGVDLKLRTHGWPAPMAVILEAKTRVEREIARARHSRRRRVESGPSA